MSQGATELDAPFSGPVGDLIGRGCCFCELLNDVLEWYIKLLRDRDDWLEWAEKIGIGFELPGSSVGEKLAKTPSIGQLGQLIQFRKTG